MPYRVKLQNFEGPLDLLLFLIKKNEVNIYDIPIAEITRQYLEYLEIISLLDLESASDFIYLAATLIRIKAKMLLPKPPGEDEEEEEDPRLELVQRLLEYKRFKDLTPYLAENETIQRDYYPRHYFDLEIPDEDEPVDYSLTNVSLFQLMEVFKKVLEKAPKPTFHRVEILPITLEEQIEQVLDYLKAGAPLLFRDLIIDLSQRRAEAPLRLLIIVTFIAILELFKRDQILFRQQIPFGDIWIQKK